MVDEPRSGRSCTSKTDENVTNGKLSCGLIKRLRVRMINSELNLSHQTVHDILTEELDMRKIRVNLVSKNLTNKQKKKKRKECVPGPS